MCQGCGKCVSCGKNHEEIEEMFFSIKDNGIKCANCAKQDKGAIKLNQTVYTSLCYILSADAKKIFSFEIPENAVNELRLIAKIYTNEKLEKEYK